VTVEEVAAEASPAPAPLSPILPPATIGILGGGQLGRMLGFAGRAMGYRVVVLDPDPDCPSAAIADRVLIGAYDDVAAARALAAEADVVTYELEHVALDVVRAAAEAAPVRPGGEPLRVTQDRLAERRFVEAAGIAVAPWRAVTSVGDLRAAAVDLGAPLRLKATTGGYDGRSQVRVATPADVEDAFGRLGRPAGEALLAERELAFAAELSVIVARGFDGKAVSFPPARNVHDDGILVESVAPADLPPVALDAAVAIGSRLAEAMDLVGTLTAELFLLRDGSLAVNELAPRVHNSGHWTIEGAATSQFEQHVRAICGLPLGPVSAHRPTAIVNVLGTGPSRDARLLGVAEALAVPESHLHLYDKRRVFERRKMGHVTALGATTQDALDRARAARARLHWAGGSEEGEPR
jgi:5-(carboxyamino)imidazole ribonucleotide synthase